jgi:hypothetical protein
MFKKETKEVTITEEVKTHAVCDVCGKEVLSSDLPDNWHEISAHHNDWGNDSIDSYKESMVCSPGCYKIMLKKIVSEFEEYNTAEVDGMNIKFAKSMVLFLYAT